VAQPKLKWQSKLILMLVLPAVAADVVLETHWWIVEANPVAIWTIGLSLLLGMVAFKLRSATLGAAFAGAAITASLMFSSVTFPYLPWQTALVPVLALLALTSIATRQGHKRKEFLGTAESRKGRAASQVAANLGAAALLSNGVVQSRLIDTHWFTQSNQSLLPILSIGLAALCEAAADTVSSELGQVLSGRPRMITTLRTVEAGTDGAMSLYGTLAGVMAACIVGAVGSLALGGGMTMFAVSWFAGIFGLFFDSLLGATLERRGWINNDAVNFLSTLSAAAFALGLLVLVAHLGIG
jgi:uncharacterized protein (TIGR00297 family)